MARELPERVKKILDKKKARSVSRFVNTKEVKQTFLIICEGENTEPDYFNAFRLTSARVKALGEGFNTVSLIARAIAIKEQEASKGRKYDQYWVVFDKDDFPTNDFNQAITVAVANGFQVAYSNQSFEYWFILHFNLYQGQIHRNTFAATLSGLLGFDYSKEAEVSVKMYEALEARQPTAAQNALHVENSFAAHVSPAQRESSTTVHLLVQELNRFIG